MSGTWPSSTTRTVKGEIFAVQNHRTLTAKDIFRFHGEKIFGFEFNMVTLMWSCHVTCCMMLKWLQKARDEVLLYLPPRSQLWSHSLSKRFASVKIFVENGRSNYRNNSSVQLQKPWKCDPHEHSPFTVLEVWHRTRLPHSSHVRFSNSILFTPRTRLAWHRATTMPLTQGNQDGIDDLSLCWCQLIADKGKNLLF